MQATFDKIHDTAFGEMWECYQKTTINMVQWCNGLAGVPAFANNEKVAEFRKLYFEVDNAVDEIDDGDDRLSVIQKFQIIFEQLVDVSQEIVYLLEFEIHEANTVEIVRSLELMNFGMVSLLAKFKFMLLQCEMVVEFAYRYM